MFTPAHASLSSTSLSSLQLQRLLLKPATVIIHVQMVDALESAAFSSRVQPVPALQFPVLLSTFTVYFAL